MQEHQIVTRLVFDDVQSKLCGQHPCVSVFDESAVPVDLSRFPLRLPVKRVDAGPRGLVLEINRAGTVFVAPVDNCKGDAWPTRFVLLAVIHISNPRVEKIDSKASRCSASSELFMTQSL